jgi:hypothetical protein
VFPGKYRLPSGPLQETGLAAARRCSFR